MVVLHFDVEGILGGNSYTIHIHKIIITNELGINNLGGKETYHTPIEQFS